MYSGAQGGKSALTEGCILALACGTAVSGSVTPLVQVIGKKVARETAKDSRTLLRISDGCHYLLAVLGADLKDPEEGSVIQLLEWTSGIHEGLPAVFVDDWDQSSPDVFRILGQPVGVMTGKATTTVTGTTTGSLSSLPKNSKDQEPPPKPEASILRSVATPLRKRSDLADPVETSPSIAGPRLIAEGPPSAQLRDSHSLPLVPIAQLSLFMQRCRIRARVLSKSGCRTFTNARGTSKMFSMDLMDAEGACTRAACFGAAVDRFYATISVKKTYEISGAAVKQANPRYCRYPMQLTLDDRWTSVSQLPEDGSIPAIPYKFVAIGELGHAPIGSSCDVMAVIQSVDEAVSVSTRSSGVRMKRQVMLMDDSSASIAMNLWGEKAEMELAVGCIVFLRQARLSDYLGRSLDLNEGSFLEANPDDPRAFRLQAWYQKGRDEPVRQLSAVVGPARGKKRNIAEALAEDALLQAGVMPGTDRSVRAVNFHQVSATVVAVRNERAAPFYWGCTTEVPGFDKPRLCNKKVENGQCAAGHICPEPAARFNMLLQVADAFATVHCRAFGAEAEVLADVPAAEVAVLEDERMAGNMQAEKTYTRIFRNMFRRWTLTLKCRKENYEGRVRLQVSVERCVPVDFVAEGLQMAHEVRRALCMV